MTPVRPFLTGLLLLAASVPASGQDTLAAVGSDAARARVAQVLGLSDSVLRTSGRRDPRALVRTRALQGPWIVSFRPDSAGPAHTVTATFHLGPEGPAGLDTCGDCVEATLPARFLASLPSRPSNGRLWLSATAHPDSLWLYLGWAGGADDGGWRGVGLLTTAGASGACWQSGYVEVSCGTWTLSRPKGWKPGPALPN